MSDSKSLFELSKEIFPGGVNSPVRKYSPYPVFIESGNGSRITDVDGNEYVDYCLAFGPMILGHSDKHVTEALRKQLDRITLTGAPTPVELDLARKIRSAVPSMEMMRFANSGSEAVLHSLRLARAYTGRDVIIRFAGSYHGASDYNLAGIEPGGGKYATSPGIPDSVTETVAVGKYGDTGLLKQIFRNYRNRIAAVIVEPVMANTGLLEPDIGFLKELRDVTSENGSLLIFDEIVTGFRFRYGCYQDMVGIRPDLTTLSKIVGGGLPLSVFGGGKEIMENVAPEGKVYVAGTFSGNPLSATAGLATLERLEKKDYRSLESYVSELSSSIEKEIEKGKRNASVNSVGSMFQVFFSRNVRTHEDSLKANREEYGRFFSRMLKNGIYLPSSQFETLFTSFSHDDSDFEKTSGSMAGFFRDEAR